MYFASLVVGDHRGVGWPPMEVDMDLVKEWSKRLAHIFSLLYCRMAGREEAFLAFILGLHRCRFRRGCTGQAVEEEDDYALEYDSGEPLPSGLDKTGGIWESPWTQRHYGECFLFISCSWELEVRVFEHLSCANNKSLGMKEVDRIGKNQNLRREING